MTKVNDISYLVNAGTNIKVSFVLMGVIQVRLSGVDQAGGHFKVVEVALGNLNEERVVCKQYGVRIER